MVTSERQERNPRVLNPPPFLCDDICLSTIADYQLLELKGIIHSLTAPATTASSGRPFKLLLRPPYPSPPLAGQEADQCRCSSLSPALYVTTLT
jgi:hypothetical protein